MIIRVGADGAVQLLEPGDLRRFSIAMPDTDAARAGLATVARPAGHDHAWIAPERVRALAAGAPPEWDTQFAAMVAYAAGKGWTDADGWLRAHIVYD